MATVKVQARDRLHAEKLECVKYINQQVYNLSLKCLATLMEAEIEPISGTWFRLLKGGLSKNLNPHFTILSVNKLLVCSR